MARTDNERQYAYYPAFLDLRRKHVVVVGGGDVATDKVTGLLPCGPVPLVVYAPRASDTIQDLASRDQLTWYDREYQRGDLAGADICFAVTEDRALNARVADEARERGIPVLAVDDIPNCDFIAPALVRRGDLTIAISTNGKSPAMASHVRRKIERDIPPEWADLMLVAAETRTRLGDARRRISAASWQGALDDELKSLVWQGKLDEASELLYGRLISRVKK